MSKPLAITAAVLLAAGCLAAGGVRAQSLQISAAQAEAAGNKLWKNECGGTVAGLTSWNAGEDFASLGIGHYIWYPAGRRAGFEESFPELVAFLQTSGVALPAWLRPGAPCPWNSRADFQRDQSGARMTELRRLLASTVPWQARFSARRLEGALPENARGRATGTARNGARTVPPRGGVTQRRVCAGGLREFQGRGSAADRTLPRPGLGFAASPWPGCRPTPPADRDAKPPRISPGAPPGCSPSGWPTRRRSGTRANGCRAGKSRVATYAL